MWWDRPDARRNPKCSAFSVTWQAAYPASRRRRISRRGVGRMAMMGTQGTSRNPGPEAGRAGRAVAKSVQDSAMEGDPARGPSEAYGPEALLCCRCHEDGGLNHHVTRLRRQRCAHDNVWGLFSEVDPGVPLLQLGHLKQPPVGDTDWSAGCCHHHTQG